MKCFRIVGMTLLMVAFVATAALADPLEQYKQDVQALLTKEKVKSMLDVAKMLKSYGASYQKALTTSPDLAGRFKDGESRRVLVGMYQFDAVYAAAFGKKKETVEFLSARKGIVGKMNLSGQMDVSALFPKTLNSMLKNPDKVSFEDVVQAYADNAPMYKEMMDQQIGFEVIEASLYGFALEGLYVSTQSLLISGMDPEMMKIMGETVTLMEPIIGLYNSFTDIDHYAKYVDPDNFLEAGERAGWLRMLLKIIVDKKENLTEKQVKAIAEIVAKERAEVFSEGM